MKTSDFDYSLPKELIAEYPLEKRSSSRLLVYQENIEHKSFKDVVSYFDKGDLLVLNNTSVIPARIFGKKESGGSVEVMLERIMEENKALVQIGSGNSPKIGTKLILEDYEVECIDRKGPFFILQFNEAPLDVFNKIGHVPLPPYIKRSDEQLDKERYGTVYEDKELQDSVAAPTAGLHFDKNLLKTLEEKGVIVISINLSVGAGTFQPVKTANIKDHDIHKEYVEVKPEVIDLVNETKANGKRVFAVGTTATRALETAFVDPHKNGYKGYTKLFIYPAVSYTHLTLPTILLV